MVDVMNLAKIYQKTRALFWTKGKGKKYNKGITQVNVLDAYDKLAEGIKKTFPRPLDSRQIGAVIEYICENNRYIPEEIEAIL